jgi:hypothetical protein
MTRNLKALFGTMLALAAFGGFASNAQAAEFHCSVEPCRFRFSPDGEGKNAHHVFIIDDKQIGEGLIITCGTISGEGTQLNHTAAEITVTNISYKSCTLGGSSSLTINMSECSYLFAASGTVTIKCPEKQTIRAETPGCVYRIPPQGPLTGISYTTIGSSPNREITVATNVKGIAVTIEGFKSACILDPSHSFEGTDTTGNSIATAETDPEPPGTPVMADGWWL